MRNTPPSDYTQQEKNIAEVLSEFGLRYKEQEEIGKYRVDFLIPEIDTVIEADGIYGHLKKADKKRDEELEILGVKRIIHISSVSKIQVKHELMDSLWQE